MRSLMVFLLLASVISPNLVASQLNQNTKTVYRWKKKKPISTTLMQIDVPEGYERVSLPPDSFGAWLRHMPLKPHGSKVFLYNGDLKSTQNVHAAVLDIDVGKRDRQQCADAVMRLRAEYLYSRGKAHNVCFRAVSRKEMCFRDYRTIGFRRYLSNVFAFSNSRSLFRMLKKPEQKKRISPGDVFIEPAGSGGYGHAVIVMDVAQNSEGEQIFILAQSYMPAQQIHILKNPATTSAPAPSNGAKSLGPWYRFAPESDLETPQWHFKSGSRRQF